MRKHISREHSKFKHKIVRDYDEFWKVEIISYEHELTQSFLPSLKNIKSVNAVSKTNRSWSALTSANGQNYTINCEYYVKLAGEYRIDIIYENKTDSRLNGVIDGDKDIIFDGDATHLKRITYFKEYSVGNQTITVTIPKNTFFYGLIVRKTKEYVFNSVELSGYNMVANDVDFTSDSQINPSECSFSVLFDDAFESDLSPSGYYMDYNDEVNVYLKGLNDDKETQVFGGYLSSILPNDKRTELNISCADRMIDGQNKYLLQQMTLLGGTTSKEDKEYTSEMDRDFKTYGQALKFLCKSFETTLQNNIDKDNLISQERGKKDFVVTFGSKKKIKKVSCKNASAKFSKNFVTLRNNGSAQKKQEIILYTAKDHTTSPPEITNYKNMGLVYGLGDPVKQYKEKTTELVEKGDGNAGAVSFNKCGVSKDGKFIMAIGLPSASGDMEKTGGYTWHKRMFHNECPYCKKIGRPSNQLVFDIFYGDSNGAGRSPCNNNQYESGGGVEGHIFCKSCDSDYSIVTGKRHGGTGGNLKPASPLQKSSKAEAQKLKRGEYVGTPTGESLSANDIFDAIWNLAKKNKFKYQLHGNTTSTASGLESSRVGDCWAFSEWIFNQLKKYKVNCRVVQYATSQSKAHRTVQYKDKNNKWVDYPYGKHGWHSWLHSTSGSKHPSSVPFKYTAGGNIASAVSKSGVSQQTTTVTVYTGYDKDKPLQGYFAVTVSTKKSFKAPTKTFYVGFTQKAGSALSLTGFNPVWINKTTKQINVDLMSFVKNVYNDFNNSNKYYLHSIKFIAPTNKEDWYKNDNSTRDEASCKIDLYSIDFNDNILINPDDLDSCGKNVNSMFEELLEKSNYTAKIEYSKHRKDDIIYFNLDNQSQPVYVAHEGDTDNYNGNHDILDINGISYTPRSSLFNMSVVVFKDNKNRYNFVDTKDAESILKYGEQTTLQTSSEIIGSKEAYFNAMNNKNYNPSETFNFSIVLPYFVKTNVGDLVKVVANSRKLNTLKTVASVKYHADNHDIPKIQTELGLGELPVDLQIAKELREIRASAKKDSTIFSASAEPILDDEVYEWDN